MTTFSRTTKGISNYPLFYGCDFVVFTEGKETNQTELVSEERPDVQYYREVLRIASNGLTPKIKCIGNKMAALDYAEQIVASGTNNLIVIVDKDLEGVTCSPIPLRCVIRTQGYSWENELWSPKVINEVARIISNSNIMVASLINKNLPMLQKRLKYLSLLNAVSCLYGTALLSNSNSLAGIRFRLPSLPVDEVKRISSQFKSSAASGCSLSRNIIRESSNAESRAIIRGHLWENVAFRLISYAYKQATGENFPPNGVLQRIAFSVLKRDVNSAIGSDLTKYYRDELLRLSVIT
jgi:hypothetical protein